MSAIALAFGKLAAKPLAFLGVFAIVLTAGFAGGVAWEHRGPLGFPGSLLGDSLAVQRARLADQIDNPLTGLRAELRSVSADRDGYVKANARCERERVGERDRAAAALSKASAVRAAASSNFFDQGYAAGRLAGRKLCEVNREENDPTGLPGGGASGGMRDSPSASVVWNAGAYRPGGPVSPGGQRRQ